MATINGTKNAETLNGTSSADIVYAQTGNDTIRGYGGNDILWGDTTSGDSGSDVFIFESTAAANGVDTLMDYSYSATKGAEQDVLDFTAMFGALGSKAIITNYAKFQVDGDKVALYVDKDGTGKLSTWEKIAVFNNFAGGESVRIKAGTSFFTLTNAPTPVPLTGEVLATVLLPLSGTINATGVTKIIGTGADVKAVFDKTNITLSSSVAVDITNEPTVAQLTAIDAATTGTITYTSVSDTAANLAADAATNTGAGTYITGKNVTLSDAHTLAQLLAINNATTGTITLFSSSVALSGSAADIIAALTGISGYTGAITLASGTPTVAQLTAIDAATTGTITYTSVSDTAANLAADAATNAGAGTYITGKNVTLSDAHTLAQLLAINNATTGTITLFSSSVALSGSAADIIAALAGISGYTGDLTATGTASADTINLSSLSTGVMHVDGAAQNDTITTGSANDFITGGAGDDTLTGGGGSDTFIYAFGTGNGTDNITDFTAGASGDIIDLTGTSDVSILANSNEGVFASQALSTGANASDIALTNGFTKITGVTAATQSAANIATTLANGLKAGVCVGNSADVVYIAIGVTDVDPVTGGNQAGTVIARVTGGSDTVINDTDITVLAVLVGVSVANLTTDNFTDF